MKIAACCTIVVAAGLAASTQLSFSASATSAPQVRTAADLSLPLDRFDLSSDEQSIVQEARFKLLKACMRTFDAQLAPPEVSPVRVPRNAAYLQWLGHYEVAKYGYAGPPGLAEEIDAAQDGRRGFAVSRASMQVLKGQVKEAAGRDVPAGGCDGRVAGLLDSSGGDLVGSALPAGGEQRLYEWADEAAEAGNDPRLHEAEAVWSACMKDAGFDYATPIKAQLDPRWAVTVNNDDNPPPRGTADEIRTAVADEKCRISTNYYGARKAIYTEYQEKLIAEHRTELDAIRSRNSVRLENAQKYLRGGLKLPSIW